MVILKGKRNGACIIHSAGSLIFPLIIPSGKERPQRKKKNARERCNSEGAASSNKTSTR